jgi:hypothetical protein
MSTRIYRVVVRGHFHGLDDEQRANLRAAAPDYEIFKSAYTRDGTLTYEPNLVAFSFRYELRDADETLSEAEAQVAVSEVAMEKARESLAAMGVDHRHLRTTVTNMANVWS